MIRDNKTEWCINDLLKTHSSPLIANYFRLMIEELDKKQIEE